MTKRLGFAIAIIAAVLFIFFLVWQLWPRSSSDLLSGDENAVTGFSASAVIHDYERDRQYQYSISYPSPLWDQPGEVLEILSTSQYRQDLRNLLPWKTGSIDSVQDYDGRRVSVILYLGKEKGNYTEFMFLSSGTVLITTADCSYPRIYHPTNALTLDRLSEFLQTHGAME